MNKISIIIPTFNEEKYLPKLLDCLKNQTFKNFEVIIADANSTDKTLEIAKKFKCNVTKGGLPAEGRNNGAKIAQGDLLLFIDSDITFDNNFLEKVIPEFEKRKLDLAIPNYNLKYVKKLKYLNSYLGWYFVLFWSQYSFIPQSSSQLLLIRKSVFESLNGFDEKIRISEDIDIVKRAARKKFKYRVLLKAKIYPSVRRYEKYGLLKPSLAGLVGSVLVYTNQTETKKMQYFIEKVYGGWGSY